MNTKITKAVGGRVRRYNFAYNRKHVFLKSMLIRYITLSWSLNYSLSISNNNSIDRSLTEMPD